MSSKETSSRSSHAGNSSTTLVRQDVQLNFKTSNPSRASKPATTFHLFPNLPAELRKKIWEAARPEPRVVRVSTKGREWGSTKGKVPALLHVCFESRQIALQWYKLSFKDSPKLNGGIYFDHSVDFAYISCRNCQGRGRCCSWWNCPMRATIQTFEGQLSRLAIEIDFQDATCPYWSFVLAEEGLLVDSKKGLATESEAKLSHFKRATAVPRYSGDRQHNDLLRQFYLWWNRSALAGMSDRTLKNLTAVEYEKPNASASFTVGGQFRKMVYNTAMLIEQERQSSSTPRGRRVLRR
ncbi:uncharacterized protein LY89DRAFT_733589 [Mollisia scopiformis]|uniref:2EXR domain-containing protein n=1 Tax=Mollisia scopiformis TaxID=149040 RepID=A0A194XC64_MOLSC|nr:uncharacterized protein LY89DRAFT_733589 [Mollisia scopiformis]KUJ17763.1 hypothetical protein LY89DRAFT_733589 [Mollisia scopiformis]